MQRHTWTYIIHTHEDVPHHPYTDIHRHTCIYIHIFCTYLDTYTLSHTYIHTYIHRYIHTYIHTCMHACIHTCRCGKALMDALGMVIQYDDKAKKQTESGSTIRNRPEIAEHLFAAFLVTCKHRNITFLEWPPPETLFWHSFGYHLEVCIAHLFWHSFWDVLSHSIWPSIWHPFWHRFWHIFWHFFRHSFWHLFSHSLWQSMWHPFWPSFLHSVWCLTFSLAFGCNRAVPTEIRSPQWRTGSAHWGLELTVHVRQRPLRSGARGWCPAVPTEMRPGAPGSGPAVPLRSGAGSAQLRSGARGWGRLAV